MGTFTVKQNQDCKDFKDVYIDNKLLGCVMADDTMSAYECYQSLKNNWEIDNLEGQSELLIALQNIEQICDNQNPTHEQIWRIAYEAINSH